MAELVSRLIQGPQHVLVQCSRHEHSNSGFTEQNMGSPMQLYFNPGATMCFYQSMVNLNMYVSRMVNDFVVDS